MLPPFVPEDNPSEGERTVFVRLRDDPDSKDWIVLHSLALARHRSQVAGELDFVVIIPGAGVLCLEVKGYPQVSCKEGLWYYGPGDLGSPRSPFRQASDGMHSLRRFVTQHRPELKEVQFTSGAIFPFAVFDQTSPEWHWWEIIDASRFALPISQSLRGLMAHSREHLTSGPKAPNLRRGSPTPDEAKDLCTLLRPSFEVPLDPRARKLALAGELSRFTSEQFVALDAMSANPRTIYVGPAGTGKTLLALEAARRAYCEGRRTLLVCFNRLLGLWLERETIQYRAHVEVTTLHRQMLRLARLDGPPRGSDSYFWATELPRMATAAVKSSPDTWRPFELLLVDEAQDLLRGSYLEFLSSVLDGGLSSGNWRMFGDFENAALYGTTTMTLAKFRESVAASVPVFNLRVNCRNTPTIAEWVHLLARLHPKYTRVLRPNDGIQPSLRFYSSLEQQGQLLEATIESLLKAGLDEHDIVVLSTRAAESCANWMIQSPSWRSRLEPLGTERYEAIRFGSIHAFKGLEAPAIVVTDVHTIGTSEASSILYVAITRALQRLVIFAHDAVRAEALQTLTGTLGRPPASEVLLAFPS